MQGVCTGADSVDLETLASSCPMLNGTVVFQARAFHNSYYNEFKHYEDNCPRNIFDGRTENKNQLVTAENKTLLRFYPNPTTGIVYVSVNDGGNHTFQTEIYDISGKLVLKEDLYIEGGIGSFKLDAENGMYMMNLHSNGSQIPSVYRIILNK